MSFVTPGSKSFYESGLAKSAFKNTIYDDLPLDVYMPSIKNPNNGVESVIAGPAG